MKKCKKSVASLIMFFALLGGSVISVNAQEIYCEHGYLSFNDHQLVGGVGNYGDFRRYSYVDSSASDYADIIETALSQWTNTSITTSISLRTTADKPQSSFDFVGKSASDDGENVTGQTFFYTYAKSNGEKDPYVEDWGWSEIELYDISLNGDPMQYGSNYNLKLKVVAHELGHAMGLSHADNPEKLMAQSWRGGTVTSATYHELYTINI